VVSTVTIANMHAVHAVRAIQTALTAVEGITSADVRLGVAVIEHDGRATADLLRSAIAAAGFDLLEIREEPRRLNTTPTPRS
jgi:copper chaperone CopZ